jgi:hypothetical protein
MNRNRLKGSQGDQLNVILSAAGMNFSKLLKQKEKLWHCYIRWMLNQAETQLHMLFKSENCRFNPVHPTENDFF